MSSETELSASEIARLQKLWDIFLLTSFFEDPGLYTRVLTMKFMNRHNLSENSFRLLKRTPFVIRGSYWWHISTDVYCFVARNLNKIFRYIETKSIEDIFEIQFKLRHSGIETTLSKKCDKEKLMFRKQKNDILKKIDAELDIYYKNYGKGCVANANFFKRKA